MNSEKKITVREGGWDDFWILRDGIGEEQHIHAMNRPDIFADLEESPFGPEDFRLIMEDENSFFLVAEVDGKAAGMCNVKLKKAPVHPVVLPRRYAYIDDICILPDFRHMGVERRCMMLLRRGSGLWESGRWSLRFGRSMNLPWAFMRPWA